MTIQQKTITNRSMLNYHMDARPPVWAGSPIHRLPITGVAIRPALPADAPLLARLGASMLAEAHRSAFKAKGLTTDMGDSLNVPRVAAELIDPAHIFLIAEIGGQPGGFIKLSATLPPASVQTPSPIELAQLYLEPRWMRRGIGSRLMINALAQAAYQGYATCWLSVWEGNRRAIKFFLNWGFRPVTRESVQGGRSVPAGLVLSRIV
jgi:diamine N-acetyltransferase